MIYRFGTGVLIYLPYSNSPPRRRMDSCRTQGHVRITETILIIIIIIASFISFVYIIRMDLGIV